ncbi:MAG: gliding motility-associated C-terminal domain-containing protein [Flavobacteriaceae bacterium]|jgi:gliding motility-associated-like protein|nr:gliding motility-associated C-terminal domain-containing protein [Flavobacteriaceae bacterium]
MKKNLIPLVLLLGLGAFAQEKVVVNSGVIFVSPNTDVLVDLPFENQKEGNLKNGGELHLKNKLTNEGIIQPDKVGNNKYNGKLLLTQENGEQIVEGGGAFELNNVEFNNKGTSIQGDVQVYGQSDFEKGIVKITDDNLALTYRLGGKVGQVSDESYVEGVVEREGNEKLVLPIGAKGLYRPAVFGAGNNAKDLFTGKYIAANPLEKYPHDVARSAVEVVDSKEYWEVKTSSKAEEGLLLSLSWNDKITPSELLTDADEKLGIARWDEEEKKWVSEGGLVDMSERTVVVPVAVKKYGVFTLARVNKNFVVDDSVIVRNAVSPNGDGLNDYFIIENIHLHPDNTVRIYNRWGVKVFETNNYDSNGNGTVNVFNGTATGKGVIGGGKLPSGTYYYDLRYVKTDNKGSQTFKKAGYLHLEND